MKRGPLFDFVVETATETDDLLAIAEIMYPAHDEAFVFNVADWDEYGEEILAACERLKGVKP